MEKQKRGLLPYLFLFTLTYFALGFVSIVFANLAIFCVATPFVLLSVSKKKLWCQHYCPRASLLNQVGRKKPWSKSPLLIRTGRARTIMLWYFGLNLLFIIGSTTRIALGKMEPFAFIRLFIFIPLFPLPQLIHLNLSPVLLHLSYRFYSMMLSSTILAAVLARIYRPRIWCAMCPVGTLSNTLLK